MRVACDINHIWKLTCDPNLTHKIISLISEKSTSIFHIEIDDAEQFIYHLSKHMNGKFCTRTCRTKIFTCGWHVTNIHIFIIFVLARRGSQKVLDFSRSIRSTRPGTHPLWAHPTGTHPARASELHIWHIHKVVWCLWNLLFETSVVPRRQNEQLVRVVRRQKFTNSIVDDMIINMLFHLER